MRLTVAAFAIALPLTAFAQTQQGALRPEQQLAHDIYKELIEINTVDSVGNVTLAAKAVEKRLLDAGFPASDVQVIPD